MSLYNLPISEQKPRLSYYLTSSVKLMKSYFLIIVLDSHILHPMVEVGALKRKMEKGKEIEDEEDRRDYMRNFGLLGYLKEVLKGYEIFVFTN